MRSWSERRRALRRWSRQRFATTRLRQWKYGYFEHRIQFPEAVDPGALRASFEAGVLLVRIPKAPD